MRPAAGTAAADTVPGSGAATNEEDATLQSVLAGALASADVAAGALTPQYGRVRVCNNPDPDIDPHPVLSPDPASRPTLGTVNTTLNSSLIMH